MYRPEKKSFDYIDEYFVSFVYIFFKTIFTIKSVFEKQEKKLLK